MRRQVWIGVQAAMFARLVTVRGLTMGSGLSFSFDPDHASGLLQGYKQRQKMNWRALYPIPS
jgi:hypothetical protein